MDVVARLLQRTGRIIRLDDQCAVGFRIARSIQNAYAKLQGTWNQDLIQPQEFALQRLPDLTVTGRQELFNNLMFADYDAEAVNFYRYEGS